MWFPNLMTKASEKERMSKEILMVAEAVSNEKEWIGT